MYRIIINYNDLHCDNNILRVRTFDIVFADIKMLARVIALLVWIQGTTSVACPI